MIYSRCLPLAAGILLAAGGGQAATTFDSAVQPLLSRNCYGCHNSKLQSGDLNLQAFQIESAVTEHRDQWEAVLRKLKTGEMPPKGLPRPDPAAVKTVTAWIQSQFDRADALVKPDPGRVTARRLNRAEYNNTVRDLLGVTFHPAEDFPQDDSGYGFDNIGDVLSLSPVLMEKYLSAAEKVVSTALSGPEAMKPTVVRHQPPYRAGTDGGDNSRYAKSLPFTITDYDLTGLALPSALHTMHNFPATGEYVIRIDPEGNRPRPSDPFTVAVWMDGKQVATTEFEASQSATSMEGEDKTVRIRVPAGDHWVAVSALRLYEGLPAKYRALRPLAALSRPPVRHASSFSHPRTLPPKNLPNLPKLAPLRMRKRTSHLRLRMSVSASISLKLPARFSRSLALLSLVCRRSLPVGTSTAGIHRPVRVKLFPI